MRKVFGIVTVLLSLAMLFSCELSNDSVLKPLSSQKELTSFSFPAVPAIGSIVGTDVAVSVPFGTPLTALVAQFTTSGSSVKVGSTPQVSGTTANNFTTPVVYRVAAADGSVKDYTVTVTPGPSPAKELTSFSFAAIGANGVISGNAIAVSVPSGTSLGALVATFTTTGASVSVGSTTQVSGTTANNFASSVVYRVMAADGTFQDYTVTVTISDPFSALVGTYKRSETSEYDPTNLPGASALSNQTLVVAPSGSPSSVILESLPNDLAKTFGFTEGTLNQVVEVTVLSGGGTTAVTVLMHVTQQSGTGLFAAFPIDLAKAWTKNLYTLTGNTLTTQVSEGSPNAEEALAVTSYTATQTWTKQ